MPCLRRFRAAGRHDPAFPKGDARLYQDWIQMSINRKTKVELFAAMTGRIEQVREELGLSKPEFCRRLGFPYPSYMQITGERRTKPSVGLLQALAEHTDVSPRWLLSGAGPMHRGDTGTGPQGAIRGAEGAGAAGTDAGAVGGAESDYVLVPLYGVQGGAGEGATVHGEEVEDLLAFKREWITRELRTRPERLALIHVRGESMVPTLAPGDVILVERNHGATVSDGVYVIRMGEALLVKRVQLLPEGALMVTSDNPAYQPFRVSLREPQADFAIVGRVVWAGRRF
jgi:phage repressor protein C with HTH and peptisase S24 domain